MVAFLHHDLAAPGGSLAWAELEQELQAESRDGYPALELLEAGLPSAVVLATLGSWVEQLARYSADLAQADTDALMRLRERIRISYGRLQCLHQHVQQSVQPPLLRIPPRACCERAAPGLN